MDKDQLSRELAVILHADVVGSTSLVQKDEALAHQRIQVAFKNFSKTIGSYGGLTREIRGDALVAQFKRASDAVCASLAFQKLNTESNSNLQDDICPELRIGISLGEVIVADSTMTGEGVVLAQRLEQLAEPGGVVVQGSVSETVPARMPFEFERLAEQELKGFNQSIRAFSVSLCSDEKLPKPEAGISRPKNELGSFHASSKLSSDSYETLIGERFELPDKPSIAVLPFLNLSDDPGQEFFADGMAEEIIISLSRVPDLVVIARDSTFVYKGCAVDVRQVGRDLGVHHVLEGSVRKSGDRIRITAQLVDTQTGDHVWAEHYDRSVDDIFSVQDEITHNIVVELRMKLVTGEETKTRSGTSNIKAWELAIRADRFIEAGIRHDTNLAKQLVTQALDLDNRYSAAWILLGWIHFQEAVFNWSSDPEKSMQMAHDAAQTALSIDEHYPDGYSLLCYIFMERDDIEQAAAMSEKALDLAPDESKVLAISADVLFWKGRIKEGIKNIQRAIRHCPFPPAWYFSLLGIGFQLDENNEAAILALEHAIEIEPNSYIPYLWLTSTLVDMGRLDEAKKVADHILEIEPEFSVRHWAKGFNSEIRSGAKANLLAVGLPE